MFLLLWASLLSLACPALAATVTLRQGKYVGINANGVDTYYAIPFAQPPVGDLRLRAPQPITQQSDEIYNATSPGRSCPQATPGNPALEGEDCLHINVFAPQGANLSSNLPVMFWIYGGAFRSGSNAGYDGTSLVLKGIEMKKPVIFVAANYRVNAFGFLCSAELQAESPTSVNLGLRDQRAGLEWVRENIRAFGGDPDKVIIFGESAGAISASLQLVGYNGDIARRGLARGAILQSGSLNSVNAQPAGHSRTQTGFNQLVQATSCAGATDKPACLRKLSYEEFYSATVSVYLANAAYAMKLPFLPCVDGQLFTDRPVTLLQKGYRANIPVITGDNTDEGTLFNFFSNSRINTTAELTAYIESNGSGLSEKILNRTLELYPDDPTFGSPYGTGANWNLYPQYKRLSAIQGDIVFEGPRRHYLRSVNSPLPRLDVWSYRLDQPLSASSFPLPIPKELTGFLGVPHALDIPFVFGTTGNSTDDNSLSAIVQPMWISFANYLTPNLHGLPLGTVPFWPSYGREQRQILFVKTANRTVTIETDNYRKTQMDFFNEQATIEGLWQ